MWGGEKKALPEACSEERSVGLEDDAFTWALYDPTVKPVISKVIGAMYDVLKKRKRRKHIIFAWCTSAYILLQIKTHSKSENDEWKNTPVLQRKAFRENKFQREGEVKESFGWDYNERFLCSAIDACLATPSLYAECSVS